MSTALTTLYPLLNVPRCPEARQLQALRNACRRFCQDTEWWRVDLASFNTVVDQADYTLNTGISDTLILRVYQVRRDDHPLHPTLWKVSADGVLTLDPAPKEVSPIVVRIVILPTITANSTDDDLAARFGEHIAAGARYDLKRDKGSEQDPNPFYDPEGAGLALRDYNAGVGQAKMEVYHARKDGLNHIKPYRGVWK